MGNTKTIALVVPVYNEEDIIKESIQTLATIISSHDEYAWDIILVDDGSTDRSVSRMRKQISQLTSSYVTWTVLAHETNQGKGAAVQTGLRHAKADAYGFIDADLSISFASSFPTIITQLRTNDLVIGRRISRKEQYRLGRRISSWLFGAVGRRIFRLPFQDIQCGCKWMNERGKEIALSVAQARFSFDLEFLVRARKSGLRVYDMPVTWKHVSQTSVALRDGVRYILDIFSIMEVAFTHRFFVCLYALVALVLVGGMFGWVLWYGYFFSDDFTWLWHGQRIARGELHVFTAHMSTFYSPMLNAFYAFMVRAVGVVPWIYFVVGLLVHAMNAFISGILTKRLSGSPVAGLLATAFIAVAAGAYEPLVWIGANMHSIVALFMLASVWLLVEAYARQRSVLYLSGSLFFALLAFATKEIAIALPGMLCAVGFWYHVNEKKRFWLFSRAWYWILLIGVSLAYAYKQYTAQADSIWVTSGAFQFDPLLILRLPIVLFDTIVPLAPVLTSYEAVPMVFIALAFFMYFLYRGKQLPVVWFGIAWAVLTTLPVLFFQAEHWWSILASRYTYSPRIGLMMAVSALLVHLLHQGRTVRLAMRFFWILLLAIALHTALMGKIVVTEYAYVYQSGRSLHVAAEKLQDIKPDRIYVNWFRPFTHNHAHIVGALNVIAGIPEDRIVFMTEQSTEANLAEGDVELQWNDEQRAYIVVRKN